MPRNASGTYTLPTGNPVVSGDIIESSWANTTMSDIASALTNSLARDGSGGMTAPFRILDGTVSVPGLGFANETGSGLYRSAAGDVGVAVLGQRILRMRSTGLDVTGALTVSGALTAASLAGGASTGSGASGTWGISISGNAATASAAAGSSFFTNGSGTENQLGLNLSGYNSCYMFNNASAWGLYSASGGSILSHTKGSNTTNVNGGTVTINGNVALHAANYNSYSPTLTGGGASGTWGIHITGRGYPRRSDGADLNFYWSGQSGQPTWLWGGNDGNNMYVYNPSNFSVSYAATAGNCNFASGNLQVNGGTMYVGWGGAGATSIYMRDSDEGDRIIHCNSNRIGFLNQGGGWGAYCEDSGAWASDSSMRSPAYYANTGGLGYVFTSDGATGVFQNVVNFLQFKTVGIERAAIDSGGGFNVFNNKQGGWADSSIVVNNYVGGDSQPAIGFHAQGSGNACKLKYYGPGNRLEVRNSADTGWTDIYAGTCVNASDYRLKTDVEEITSALADIMGLQPKKYRLFSNGQQARGFLAHQVAPYVPEAVRGEFNAEDGRGFPVYQALDPQSILATAVGAIQELKQHIDAMKQQIAALQGAV